MIHLAINMGVSCLYSTLEGLEAVSTGILECQGLNTTRMTGTSMPVKLMRVNVLSFSSEAHGRTTRIDEKAIQSEGILCVIVLGPFLFPVTFPSY
jgi:hypothetical protein